MTSDLIYTFIVRELNTFYRKAMQVLYNKKIYTIMYCNVYTTLWYTLLRVSMNPLSTQTTMGTRITTNIKVIHEVKDRNKLFTEI